MASCGRVPAPLVSGVCAALRGRRSVRRAGIPIAHRLPAAGLGLNAACFSRRTEHSEGARRPTKLQAVRAEAEPSTVYVSPLPKDLYPRPAPNQQTLLRSFVVSGVGLHSGLPEVVRVRPAFAGEGRYFVHVAKDTINPIEEVVVVDPNEEAYEDLLVREFRKSLYDDEDLELLREARYASRIESLIKSILQPALRATTQFASSRSGLHHSCVLTLNHPVPSPSPLPPSITPQIEQKEAAAGLAPDAPRPREAPAGVAAGEIRIPATAASLSEELFLRTELKAGGASVRTVEHLLAALEALGVDNARVEVQGSGELPILDGSAAAWAEQVMLAGVGSAATAQGKALPRMVPAVSRQVTVTDGEAFVSFTPDERPRLSAGIDFTRLAPVIGRQWATWSPLDEEHFYDTVALARTFTIDLVHEDLLKRGFCKGGSYDCALVASERYYINGPERMRDEPAHHKLLDLVGDLSLLAEGGNGGLPLGHVVSYKAGHTLHARFVRAMKEAMGEAGGAKMVPTPQFEMRAASAAGAAFQMQWEGGGEQFSRDDLL